MSPSRLASAIQSVTVYGDGAVVVRTAALPAGAPSRIVLPGLPLCLADASLRLRVEGVDAEVVDAGIALDLPEPAVVHPPEDAEVQAARREEADAEAVKAALEARIGRLQAVAMRPRPEPQRGAVPAPIPSRARAVLLDAVAEESARLAGELAAASERLRQAAERRTTLAARLAASGGVRQPRPEELRKSAVATLRWRGPPASGGRLVAEYRVPGARWLPCYVVRFQPGQDRAEVQLRAAIRQRTGEDWSGVRLVVSSADALAWCPLPVLASRRLGRRQETPATGWRAPPQGADVLFADFDQALAALAAPPPEGDPSAGDADDGAEEEERSAPPAAEKRKRAMAPPCSAPAARPAPPPAPMAAAPVRAMRREAVAKCAEVADAPYIAGNAPEAPPAEPPAERADDPSAWLDYAGLRLAGPDDPRRGRLQAVPRKEAYLALLVEARVSVSIGLLQVVARADGAARDTAGDPPGVGWSGHDPAFAAAWAADVPATVPSDGGWHVLPVCSAPVAVGNGFVCVPREARQVFRTAAFANPFPAPMPAGPVDCYLGDRFLLTTRLEATGVGGELRLGLGVEQGIQVARNAVFVERSAGMFGGSTRAEHCVRVALANKLQRPVRIEVRERVPVADADGCVVELQRVEPSWQDWYPPDRFLPGGHCWQVELPPGGACELALDYVITFPAKQELAGGNRREA